MEDLVLQVVNAHQRGLRAAQILGRHQLLPPELLGELWPVVVQTAEGSPHERWHGSATCSRLPGPEHCQLRIVESARVWSSERSEPPVTLAFCECPLTFSAELNSFVMVLSQYTAVLNCLDEILQEVRHGAGTLTGGALGRAKLVVDMPWKPDLDAPGSAEALTGINRAIAAGFQELRAALAVAPTEAPGSAAASALAELDRRVGKVRPLLTALYASPPAGVREMARALESRPPEPAGRLPEQMRALVGAARAALRSPGTAGRSPELPPPISLRWLTRLAEGSDPRATTGASTAMEVAWLATVLDLVVQASMFGREVVSLAGTDPTCQVFQTGEEGQRRRHAQVGTGRVLGWHGGINDRRAAAVSLDAVTAWDALTGRLKTTAVWVGSDDGAVTVEAVELAWVLHAEEPESWEAGLPGALTVAVAALHGDGAPPGAGSSGGRGPALASAR